MRSLHNTSQATALIINHEQTTPQAIQLPPNGRHASSDYHYYADLLSPYGITESDWSLFTRQFVNANLATRNQLITLTTVSIALQIVFAFVLGPPGFPTAALVSAGVMSGPGFFLLKGHQLRRHVRNRDIAKWLAAWNTQFFAPKGLMVGFNLPGSRVRQTAVAPRAKKSAVFASGKMYRKPLSERRVARRPRVVLVRLEEPKPEAGQVPLLDPIKVSRLYKFVPSPKLITSKMRTRIEAGRQHLQDLRRPGSDTGLDGTSAETPPSVLTWESIERDMASKMVYKRRPWKRWSLKEPVLPRVKPLLLHASTRPALSWKKLLNSKKATGKKTSGRLMMLGGSRINDASQNFLR